MCTVTSQRDLWPKRVSGLLVVLVPLQIAFCISYFFLGTTGGKHH